MKVVLQYHKEAGNHKFRQESLIAVLQERQHEIRTERQKARKPESNMMQTLNFKNMDTKKKPLFIAFSSQKGGVGKSTFTTLAASTMH